MRRVKIDGSTGYVIDDVDEVYLKLERDDEFWLNQVFRLEMVDCSGRQIHVALDGLHLADILRDAQGVFRGCSEEGDVAPAPLPPLPSVAHQLRLFPN